MPMTSTQPASARSSVSPIHGNPGFIYELDDFSKSFERDLARTLTQVLLQIRRQLRQAARIDPYWAEYEDLLDVKFVNSEVQYTLTGTDERIKAALALEYGTGEEPPRSLLRKVAQRQEYQLSSLLTKKLNALVPHA